MRRRALLLALSALLLRTEANRVWCHAGHPVGPVAAQLPSAGEAPSPEGQPAAPAPAPAPPEGPATPPPPQQPAEGPGDRSTPQPAPETPAPAEGQEAGKTRQYGPGQWREDDARLQTGVTEGTAGEDGRAPRRADLELFGYDYFARAREAVDLRRLWLKRALEAGAGQGPAGEAGPPASQPVPGAPAPAAGALAGAVGPDVMQWMNVAASVPERYQLGPGDVVTLRYWTPTEMPTEVALRVDEQGVVVLPTGGRLVARGQTLAQLEANVRKELARKIRDVSAVLTLKELRTITVTITGEAYAPGTYQVPAVATLFNVLYACGGPKVQTGSLRDIQLRRFGIKPQRFDFYEFILRGDASGDVPLQPGDIVHIPLAGPRVRVEGEVFRPAIFELADGERLRDAIRFAGGIKPSGVAQRVSIESVQPGVSLRMVDANLLDTSPANNPALFDGDLVQVLSIRPLFSNLVSVVGAVDQPGRYALAPNMTVADLLERARGLLSDAYLQRADLFRTNADGTRQLIAVDLARAIRRDPGANVPLQRLDRLVVYRISDVQWVSDRVVEVSGAVQRPGTYYRADNMRMKDLLLQAGGPRPDAVVENAFLQRRNPDGTFGPLLRVDVSKAIAGDPQHNLELQDRDTLTILSIRDAAFVPEQRVEVVGAVQRPGWYRRAQGMRLRDLVQLAGNPLPEASLDVAFLQRRNADGTFGPLVTVNLEKVLAGDPAHDVTLQDQDVLTVYTKRQAQYSLPQMVRIVGAVRRPNPPWSIPATTGSASQASAVRRTPEKLDESQEWGPAEGYPRSEGMRLRDLLHLAGGLMPDYHDEVEIAHALKPLGTPVTRVSASAALRGDPQANVELADGDLVTVHHRGDFLQRPLVVAITGEVRYPGTYALTSEERVSDLVQRAGGLTSHAFIQGAQVSRNPEYLNTPEQIRLQERIRDVLQIVAREEYARAAAKADIEKLRLVANIAPGTNGTAALKVNSPPTVADVTRVLQGAQATPAQQKALEAQVAAAESLQTVTPARPLRDEDLRPAGNLRVDLARALRNPGSIDDLVLRDGDIITIPRKPVTVSVVGAVALPSSVPFVPGRSVRQYIASAGGFTPDAARDRVLLIHSNGQVEAAKDRAEVRLGDIVLVPTKVMAAKLRDLQASLDSAVRYLANGLITYAVIRAVTQ